MARISKVDLCIFCDEAPCVCRGAKKATAKPRKPRVQPASPIVESNEGTISSSRSSRSEKADVTAAMRTASKVRHQGATVKEDADAVDEISAILADPEFTAAIQALESVLHPAERRRFEQVLAAPPPTESRAKAWKQRIS